MVTAPSCSRVSGLILMADIVWLLVSRYNRYPWRHNTNIAADLQLAKTTPNVRLTAHLHILSIIMKMTLHLKKCSNSWVLHKTKHWLQITKIIEVTWRSTLSLIVTWIFYILNAFSKPRHWNVCEDHLDESSATYLSKAQPWSLLLSIPDTRRGVVHMALWSIEMHDQTT